jgi:hypothetical protein
MQPLIAKVRHSSQDASPTKTTIVLHRWAVSDNLNHVLMKTFFTIFLNCLVINILFSQGEPLPYTTGFDNVGEQAGWQEFRTGYLSTYSWSYGGPGFSAPTCLSHDYNVGGNAGDIVVDWFVSPPLNVTGTSTVSMKVKTGGFSTPTVDNCEIWFGTDNPDPAAGNYVLIGNISYMQPQYQWLDTSFNLPFTTDSGYIAIRYKTVGAAWMTYQVDNINVDLFVGIDEKQTANTAVIFPSPFSTSAQIQLAHDVENANLFIYNSYGQVVNVISGIAGQSILLERDDLPAGMYFFRLCEEDKIITEEKFVIFD